MSEREVRPPPDRMQVRPKVAAKITPKTPAIKPFAFVEDPPEHLDGPRHSQPETRKHDEMAAEREINRHARLPASGPGVVRVQASGSRIDLMPSDQEASLRLAGLRAQIGRHYDSKRKADVYRLDEMLRRGASGIDSLRLLCALNGLRLEVPEAVERSIEGYRRGLLRQKAPIPRVVWRDETGGPTGEITGEIPLERRQWGRR